VLVTGVLDCCADLETAGLCGQYVVHGDRHAQANGGHRRVDDGYGAVAAGGADDGFSVAAVFEDLDGCRAQGPNEADDRDALMELEVVEPYLYPEQGPNMGQAFARALSGMLYGQAVLLALRRFRNALRKPISLQQLKRKGAAAAIVGEPG
jgi:hypothetical protein